MKVNANLQFISNKQLEEEEKYSYDSREEMRREYFEIMQRNLELEQLLEAKSKEAHQREELEFENKEIYDELKALKSDKDKENHLKNKLNEISEENLVLKKELEYYRNTALSLEKSNMKYKSQVDTLETLINHSRDSSPYIVDVAALESKIEMLEEEKENLKQQYDAVLQELQDRQSRPRHIKAKSDIFEAFNNLEKMNCLETVKKNSTRQVRFVDYQDIYKEDVEEEVNENVSVIEEFRLSDFLEQDQEPTKIFKLNTMDCKKKSKKNVSNLRSTARHKTVFCGSLGSAKEKKVIREERTCEIEIKDRFDRDVFYHRKVKDWTSKFESVTLGKVTKLSLSIVTVSE